jgi:TrfA protein
MADSKDTKLRKTEADLLEWARKKGEEAKKTVASKPKVLAAKQLTLEMWPDAVRGVPNVVLRNALFGVSTNRKMYKTRTLIASLDGYEIWFKGEAFNQTDLDVWEVLLHLARLQPLGTNIEFTAHSLLTELGRGTGGQDHERLKEELARLGSGWAEVTWTKEKKTFAGSLINGFSRDEETGRYVLQFNVDMAKLYGEGHTLIDWAQRMALGKDNLAKWLHGHYASHASPYPYKVEKLRALSASDIERLGDFRKVLRRALDKLISVGALKSWDISRLTDLVRVVNLPSQSQRKALLKRP